MSAYLDVNNERMWKSTLFTREEVAMFRSEGQIALSLITQVDYSACPIREPTGVVVCGGYTLFPFAAMYNLVKDTKYPERQNNWLALEFGLVATTANQTLAQTSKLAYVNPNNFGEREVFSSLTSRVCPHNNVSTVLLLPSGAGIGSGNTLYSIRGDRVQIGSVLEIR